MNTVMVYLGFGGENTTICDSGTALISERRSSRWRASVRFLCVETW